MDEPCTNRMVPAGPEGSPAYFSNRNRRTSPFWVQCSSPRIAPEGVTGLFMLGLRTFVGGGVPGKGLVGWVELLRNPSASVDGFRKSSTHPTAAAAAAH